MTTIDLTTDDPTDENPIIIVNEEIQLLSDDIEDIKLPTINDQILAAAQKYFSAVKKRREVIDLFETDHESKRQRISNIDRVNTNTPYDCVICFEELDSENGISLNNCTHSFHSKCIDKWIQVQIGRNDYPVCPVCREGIFVDGF